MAYKGMTYKEYLEMAEDLCKEYKVAQIYPEEFEKTFAEYEKSGILREEYEAGRKPSIDPIILSI